MPEQVVPMPKVFIPNKSAHDFSQAEKWGELVFLSDGYLNKYAVNEVYRIFAPILEESSPNDYILLTSLTVVCCIAVAIMSAIHGIVNLLIYKDGKYVVRTINLRKE